MNSKLVVEAWQEIFDEARITREKVEKMNENIGLYSVNMQAEILHNRDIAEENMTRAFLNYEVSAGL